MRNRFPFFTSNPDIVYLDSAATSQTLDTVIEDSNDFLLNHKANAHRSGHSMGAWVDEKYHTAKSKIGNWLDIENAENRIVFNSGASQGLSDAIQIIRKKYTGHISAYIGIDAHHSLLLPLRDIGADIKYINIKKDGKLDLDAVESAMQNDLANCKILAISSVSNVLGIVQDLDRVRSLCNTYKAISIIDACQSMGKIEHNYNGFDFVAWSWHKIYGPMGLGSLMIDEKWLEINPVRPGGGSVSSVTLKDVLYLDNATKFESGTQNLQSICTLPRLLDWLIENQTSILAHDKEITKIANDLCDTKILHSETGLISFKPSVGAIEDIVMMLDSCNICVRGGNLCAEPLVKGITENTGLIRISWGAYTTTEEINLVFDKFREINERISKFV